MKRRIHQNIWGNWNGYLGTRKVIEFGLDSWEAEHWLKHGDSKPVPETNAEQCGNGMNPSEVGRTLEIGPL